MTHPDDKRMPADGIEDEAGVAIVGMSGRFPGAGNVEAFWRNIREGVDSISHFEPGELELLVPARDPWRGPRGLPRGRPYWFQWDGRSLSVLSPPRRPQTAFT